MNKDPPQKKIKKNKKKMLDKINKRCYNKYIR